MDRRGAAVMQEDPKGKYIAFEEEVESKPSPEPADQEHNSEVQ